jgi:hypothetical protein
MPKDYDKYLDPNDWPITIDDDFDWDSIEGPEWQSTPDDDFPWEWRANKEDPWQRLSRAEVEVKQREEELASIEYQRRRAQN